MDNYLVTGGAGFIGTNFIHHTLKQNPDMDIINLDTLTYAGNPGNFDDLPPDMAERVHLAHGSVTDPDILETLFSRYRFKGVIHFAAESHVDRSIVGPKVFVDTNVTGTFCLLETCRRFWEENQKPDNFRFLHVSTDEVYGSLGETGYFTEKTPYDPSSPYAASKAASDHFVKAYFRTYGLPTLITNCSNNYGPYQFPEKLIPLMILNIIEEKPLPVYGDGKNVRDWLYVMDHCDAILRVLKKGVPGETYNIGGGAERENIQIIYLLCDLLDKHLNRSKKNTSRGLIKFVTDRPGHDRRYAIDASKIHNDLGWSPSYKFEDALETTVSWYMNHTKWVDSVRSGEYRKWIEQNYDKRITV